MILALGKTWPSALQRFLQVAGALNPSQRAAGMRILDPDSPCCRRTTVWRWRADRRHALTPIGIQARPAAQALRCSATLRNSGLEQRKTHTVEGSRLDADQGSKFRADCPLSFELLAVPEVCEHAGLGLRGRRRRRVRDVGDVP